MDKTAETQEVEKQLNSITIFVIIYRNYYYMKNNLAIYLPRNVDFVVKRTI